MTRNGIGCDHKYLDQSGTMYVSFRAFCRAELAAGFARRFARGSKP